jgi:hypothetical protein
MSTAGQSDSVVTHKASTLGDLIAIAMHPAFRIGFLDARDGRAFDHDLILQRIVVETPASALKRIGWDDLLDSLQLDLDGHGVKAIRKRVEIAQYRYEEGRILFLGYGVRCRAWGHPDFPPAQVREFCRLRYQQIMRGGGDDSD